MYVLLFWLLAREQQNPQKRAKKFIELFNSLDVLVANEASYADLAPQAHAAVRAELAHPDSAEFVETYVRQGRDRVSRAAGRVRFAGASGATSVHGYMVEFTSPGRAELLILGDFDPVSLKSPPPPVPAPEWDGKVVPYASSATTGEPGGGSRWWWVAWGVLLVIAAAVFAVAALG